MTTIFKRRLAVLAILAAGVAAVLAPATSVRQTLVQAHRERDGTVVVQGYDGGAPLAPGRP